MMMMMMSSATEEGGSKKRDAKEEEEILNRQIYALGKEATQRIMAASVLVVGVRGLGAEIAKNLVLMGVHGVTLHDPQPVALADLASHFFLRAGDVGKPRAAACAERFRELSFSADVAVAECSPLEDPALLERHGVVVLAGGDLAQATALDAACRAARNRPGFLWADARGVFAFAFNDFGDGFVVHDATGEEPLGYIVSNITQDAAGGVVSVVEDSRVELGAGDRVAFSGLEGMKELCEKPFCVIREVTGRHEFRIEDDTSALSPFGGGGGYATEVKRPQTLDFAPLAKSVLEPGVIESSDFAKDGRQYLLLLAFRALWRFQEKHAGAAPRVHDSADADELLALVRELNAELPEDRRIAQIDEALVRQFAFCARGDLSPMATFIGGVVCQEALKCCSGKFMPFRQWFFFDAAEALPEGGSPADFAPIGSRYDAQIAVLGRPVQEKLEQMKCFLVGAGAIGCEVLKVWAMMGLGCGPGGMVHVTDMDAIERSNLSRQFLFRERDIRRPKSTTAADAVREMNPAFHVTSYTLRVGRETEDVFGESFYGSLDFVCTALDNVAARRYIDAQCVTHTKPMADSGTLGPKGSTQVVVPHLTESYGSSSDPPEKGIPLCTLHSFPNQIEHTIQWARDAFQGMFTAPAEAIRAYLTQPGFLRTLDAQGTVRLKTLLGLREDLVFTRPKSLADCIRWARLQFEEMFVNAIAKLVFTFPPDSLTAEGVPFWAPPKRCPHPLQFSLDDPDHLAFVEAAANLRAFNFGIQGGRISREAIAEALTTLVVPEFKPAPVKVETSESEEAAAESPAAMDDAEDEQCQAIERELPPPESIPKDIGKPAAFEKDDDSNFHIAFVTACSNLRATNYKIPTADFQRTKLIAGKIIPAMISTTAVVSGLQCIEMIKIMMGKPLSAYKNGFVNLALPLFAFSEPIAAPRVPVREGWSWTLWDKIEIRGDVTLAEFLEHFKTQYKLDVSMLSCGKSLLYSSFLGKDKRAMRLKQKMTAIVEEVSKECIPSEVKSIQFVVCCSRLEDDEDVDIPPVHLILP